MGVDKIDIYYTPYKVYYTYIKYTLYAQIILNEMLCCVVVYCGVWLSKVLSVVLLCTMLGGRAYVVWYSVFKMVGYSVVW